MQVNFSNALLLHEPESISIDMSVWKGHFATLMLFVYSCDKTGGYRNLKTKSAPTSLPVGEEDVPEQITSQAPVLRLEDLGLYPPALEVDTPREDWGAGIRYTLLSSDRVFKFASFLHYLLYEFMVARCIYERRTLSCLVPLFSKLHEFCFFFL